MPKPDALDLFLDYWADNPASVDVTFVNYLRHAQTRQLHSYRVLRYAYLFVRSRLSADDPYWIKFIRAAKQRFTRVPSCSQLKRFYARWLRYATERSK